MMGGQTISDWLSETAQSPDTRKSLWHPLALSIMNELPDRAAAAPFLRALQTAFLGHWTNACLAIPNVGLSQLYTEKAEEFLRHRGCNVRYHAEVAGLLQDGDSVKGVRLKDGTELFGSACILAIPPQRVRQLLPDRQEFEGLQSISFAPIVSTHLWYPADFMHHDFLGLIGRTTQWVFNRRKLIPSQHSGGHLSTVISAAHDIVDLSNEEIIGITVRDLQSVFGPSLPNHLYAVVIREKRGTVSLTPSFEITRPSQKTAIPNLFLAGDWTATGYPATIESAVVSANAAVGLAVKFLQEDSSSLV
jgi:zeta-carotene desaturase